MCNMEKCSCSDTCNCGEDCRCHHHEIKSIYRSMAGEKFNPLSPCDLVEKIRNGAVGVVGSDSMYRIVGNARLPEVANRIRAIKSRNPNTSLTIFISDISQMQEFGVELDCDLILGAQTYWPGTYSIVTSTNKRDELRHLTCDRGMLCFHMPDKAPMFEVLDMVGPLVATSANMKGQPNATTIDEAFEYFGDDVDFYCDVGEIEKPENIVITFVNGEVVELFNRNKLIKHEDVYKKLPE